MVANYFTCKYCGLNYEEFSLYIGQNTTSSMLECTYWLDKSHWTSCILVWKKKYILKVMEKDIYLKWFNVLGFQMGS